MATETEIKVIESNELDGVYDMTCTEAIIDHPVHGRLYICEGFGGMDTLEGGAYRWRHGVVCHLLPTDTLTTLDDDYTEQSSIREAMPSGHDPQRQPIDWSGSMIAAVARAAGL